MRICLAVLLCMTELSLPAVAADSGADHWQPVRRLLGDWTGTVEGEAGAGTVTRSYTYVMNQRFVHELNRSVYPPQPKNTAGEVHEHWGMFSHDRAAGTLILRQFHIEGFVNTYRQVSGTQAPDALVFESVAFENLGQEWRARETYTFVSDDEFVETFELAPPGKPFQTYSRAHFKRFSP